MRTHVRILGVAAVLALVTWLLTGPGTTAKENGEGWKLVLDESTAKELIKRSINHIQETLKNPPKDVRGKPLAKRIVMKKIQVAGVMIAVYAQSAKPGANKQELATYRDAALKLSKAAAAGKDADKADVQKLADALARAKANAGAKTEPVALKEYLDDEGDVMIPFKRLALGGDGLSKNLQTNARLKSSLNGIEEKIRALAASNKNKLQKTFDKETTDLALLADQVAAVANLNYQFAPAQANGKKNPTDWKDWTLEMRGVALDLAAAAKKKNIDAVLNEAQKLNSVCNKCHGVFKPE
jgi:hypothetical protein